MAFPPGNAICRDDGGGGNRTRVRGFSPSRRVQGLWERGDLGRAGRLLGEEILAYELRIDLQQLYRSYGRFPLTEVPAEVIYLISPTRDLQAGDAVRVGYTRNVKKRLASLQTGSPERLLLVSVRAGDRALEREVHERWTEHRIRGDWFRFQPVMGEWFAEAVA